MSPSDFRAALAELSLSQAGFARVAGVPPNTVSRWMRRPAIPPTAEALVKAMCYGRRLEEGIQWLYQTGDWGPLNAAFDLSEVEDPPHQPLNITPAEVMANAQTDLEEAIAAVEASQTILDEIKRTR